MFTGTLLPYQTEAVDRMCDQKKMLVAYDLGLGKTVLTIAAIENMMASGDIQTPGLIICLSSLKYQWAAQITKFTSGTSKPLVIDGTPTQRAKQYQEAFDWKTTGVNYIILNYEQVVNDWALIKSLPQGFVVLDEATAIKSFKSKRSRYVKRLNFCPVKFALTGTPIENGKAEELYSIMEFVDKSVFGSYLSFEKKYINKNYMGWIDGYKNLAELFRTVSKASIRKRQSDPDVAPYLPETLMAEPILVPFDRASKDLYKEITDSLLVDLKEAAKYMNMGINIFGSFIPDNGPIDELRSVIMPKLIALRMLCSHPFLITVSGQLFNDSIVGEQGSKYAAELLDKGLLAKVAKSPKLSVTTEIVGNFLAESPDNKCVIFTSFVGMTAILKEALSKHGAITYTGSMNAKEKEVAKVKFQTDPNVRIFISSDAGGYGVDLPQANLLINYDLPWSAGLAAQRNGRIQRASSTWEKVVIQDILMEGSIEERQRAMLQQKISVASAIIDGEGISKDNDLTLTLGSLRQFLEGA
jgi:SNF2 family DNA or RNA helicase